MRRLFRETGPDTVLLRPLRIYHGEIDDQHEHRHDEELHIWIEAEAAQQYRVLVIDILHGVVEHLHLYKMVVFAGHLLQRGVATEALEPADEIGAVLLRQFRWSHERALHTLMVREPEIAVFHHIEGAVGHHHRYRIVLLDDMQQKFEIAVDLRLRKAFGGLRPYVHALLLLLGQLLDKIIADYQKQGYRRYRDYQEYQFACALSFVETHSG